MYTVLVYSYIMHRMCMQTFKKTPQIAVTIYGGWVQRKVFVCLLYISRERGFPSSDSSEKSPPRLFTTVCREYLFVCRSGVYVPFDLWMLAYALF